MCNDNNQCNGEWFCGDGVCEQLPAVLCDSDGQAGCLIPSCLPETGECDYAPVDAACEDFDSCTEATCQLDGACAYKNLIECDGGGDVPPFPGGGEPIPFP